MAVALRPPWRQAIFFGLGSDGTVGANKAAAAIIGERTEFYSQAECDVTWNQKRRHWLVGFGPLKRCSFGEPWFFFGGISVYYMVIRSCDLVCI